MSSLNTVEPFGEGFITALCPELILFVGLILLIIVPNLGAGRFRIPGTQTRVPWFFGGNRFKLTSDPRLPSWIAVLTIGQYSHSQMVLKERRLLAKVVLKY